jgi:hypothetical protein
MYNSRDWIDMRRNTSVIIDGDSEFIGQGQWVAYRYFLRGNISNNYSYLDDVSIDGEKFKYIELIFRMFLWPRGWVNSPDYRESPIGFASDFDYTGVMKFNSLGRRRKDNAVRMPMNGDVVYTLSNGQTKVRPETPIYLRRYRVKSVTPASGDYGRPEAWYLGLDLDPTK